MLFNIDEIDQLNFFKDSALALNTVYIAFLKFDFYFFSAGNPEEKKEFKLDKCLHDLKNILFKLESILIERKNIQGEVLKVISEFNKHILDTFIHYGNGDEIYVTETLSGILKLLLNIQNLLINNESYDVVSYIPELVDFNIKLDILNESKMLPRIVKKEVDFKIIIDDLYLVKKEILDLKSQYGGLVVDHKNATSIFIDDQREIFRSSIDNLLSEFKKYTVDLKNKYDIEAKNDLDDLSVKIKTNLEEMDNLYGDINSYKSIVSKETENEISKYYSAKAKDEKRTYWWATIISVVIIIFAIVAAWKGLDNYYQNYVSVTLCQKAKEYKGCIDQLFAVREASKSYALSYLIMRLIFSLLLFLTVIYTSRIAIRAYNHWRHSENMHLKLASLRPFINQLSTDDRDQIHKDLVPDYFGKDAGLVDNLGEKFKDLPANVSAVAMKALEQISSNGNSSGTEKNGKKPEGGTE